MLGDWPSSDRWRMLPVSVALVQGRCALLLLACGDSGWLHHPCRLISARIMSDCVVQAARRGGAALRMDLAELALTWVWSMRLPARWRSDAAVAAPKLEQGFVRAHGL